MIQKLLVHNYAIIEQLEIKFSEHLTIVTGETGAGKSILLGALGLIMGNRAETKVLYNEAEKCVIEGHFNIGAYDLRSFFETHDLDYEDHIVIRRELTPSGKSRAFVNDTPVNLPILRDLTSSLVDLHQQFDTLDIHNVSFQLRMIDALAGNRDLLTDYQTDFKKYQTDQRTLAKLVERSQNSAKELDFLTFQIEEFSKAALVEGEQEPLEAELERLTNAGEIKQTTAEAFRILSEDENAIISQLQAIGQSLNTVQRYGPSIGKLYDKLFNIIEELSDMSRTLEDITEDTELDPQRIVEVQERLDLIYRLQKKHGVISVAELVDLQNSLQIQLDAIGDVSGEIVKLEQQIAAQRTVLIQKSANLTHRRKEVVPSFEAKIHDMLHQLSMEHARLQVSITTQPDLTLMGADDVQFLFAANRGSRMQAIKDVASGGELSRLTLCTKSLVASAIPLPTLIFDEIDSGVSGDVAQKMGAILQQLATHHQVIVITHSPQVAAKASRHYFVYKTHRDDRTITNVRELTPDERIRSIAVMLSQNPPSQAALDNARDLTSWTLER